MPAQSLFLGAQLSCAAPILITAGRVRRRTAGNDILIAAFEGRKVFWGEAGQESSSAARHGNWENRNDIMTQVDHALLRRMVAAIVDAAAPEQVILFGSRARGDAGADSEVDLVVVEAEPFGPGRDRRAEAVRLWRALSGIEAAADILVYSRDEVEYWRDSLNHVLARALREGRVLYDRP